MFYKIKSSIKSDRPLNESKTYYVKIVEPKIIYCILFLFLAVIVFNLINIIVYNFSPFISKFLLFLEIPLSVITSGLFFLHLYTSHKGKLKDYKKGSHELLEIGFIFILVGLLILFASLDLFLSSIRYTSDNNVDSLPIIQFSIFSTVIFLFSTMGRLFYMNRNSKITQSMIIGFLFYSTAWLYDAFLIDYNYGTFLGIDFHQLGVAYSNIKISYIIFYFLLFIGSLLFFNATFEIIKIRSSIPKWIVILLISVLAIFTLIITDRHFSYTYYEDISTYMPNFDLILTIFFLCIFCGPLIYSFYKLYTIPTWITEDRKKWVISVRLGFLLFSSFFIIEGIVNTVDFSIFSETTSMNDKIPLRIYFHLFAIIILLIASFIFLISTYDVEKWFFDELKLRSVPEFTEFDNSISLSKVWEAVDDWQSNKRVPDDEMNEKGLSLYLEELKKTFSTDPEIIKKL